MKYKLGDMVRVIGSDYSKELIGKIGEIQEIFADSIGVYFPGVHIPEEKGLVYFWSANLELAVISQMSYCTAAGYAKFLEDTIKAKDKYISELEADNKKLREQLAKRDFKVGNTVRCTNKHYYCFDQLATVKEIGEDYIVVILNSNGVLVYVNKKDLIKV